MTTKERHDVERETVEAVIEILDEVIDYDGIDTVDGFVGEFRERIANLLSALD